MKMYNKSRGLVHNLQGSAPVHLCKPCTVCCDVGLFKQHVQ